MNKKKMRVPKFETIAAFLRFKRLWMVSGAQTRARMIQHVNTVFSFKNKKDSPVFIKKNRRCTHSYAPGPETRTSPMEQASGQRAGGAP